MGKSRLASVDTLQTGSCDHCDVSVGGPDLADGANHYSEAHGYKVVHVGGFTSSDPNTGRPLQQSIVVLQANDPPPLRTPAVREILEGLPEETRREVAKKLLSQDSEG